MKKYLFLFGLIAISFLFSSFIAKADTQLCGSGYPDCPTGFTCTDVGGMYKECTVTVNSQVGTSCVNSTNCTKGLKCVKSGSSCSCQKESTQGEVCENAFEQNTPGPGNTSGPTSSITIEFPNPLEYDSVEGFLGNVLSTIRSIIIVLSIIFIVLGGIFYITSAGNDKRMTAAKGAIFASMIGLAIGIAAPSFLKEIYNIMGGNSSEIDTSSLTGLTLTEIALNFLNFLLSIIGALALIMLIIGGVMYLTSAGDEDRVKTGKKIVTYSIIGIAIALASLVIVKQVASLLS